MSASRFFRFSRDNNRNHAVICLVKATMEDSWNPMSDGSDGAVNCFLSHAPNLKEAPTKVLASLDDFNDLTVVLH